MRSKLILLILVGLLATALLAGCGPTDVADGVETHTIVGIYPMTGPLSTFAENNTEAVKLAAADINEWLEAEGKDWRLRIEIDDTQLEGPVALRKMQSWFGEGVKIFAGPMGSGEATECLSFANANQILFVSPSSTSPALSIADDWLFRFCTDDAVQGPAIAAIAKEAGAKYLIFSWRGDTWGDGLQEAAEASARGLGIEIYPHKLRYDPLKEDFTTDVALLDGYVSELVAQGVALEDIAFNLISFEEAAPFLAEAAGYDQLWDIIWIGSDGTAYSEAVKSHPTASEFAVHVKFVNSMNRLPELSDESLHDRVKGHIRETLGRDTDTYSYNSHDIIWALAMAIDEVGYDSVAVKEILPRVTDEWTRVYGASGHIVLNEAGDRAFADYDYIMLSDDLEWTVPGYYDGAAGTIIWEYEIYN